MIEAVLFDGDQTLWDFERVMRAALEATADELRAARPGPFADALTWEDLSRDRAEVGTELEGIEYNLPRLRVLAFTRTLQRLRAVQGGDREDDGALADQLATSYFTHRDRDPGLFEDTVPCLDALRPGYRIGLLSNGSRLPETIGLGGYFETVVFAQDHRVAKPDTALFDICRQQLGLAPEACVLVGDHPLNDVVGAKRAGWSAVLIDRSGGGTYVPPAGCSEVPDAVITSFTQLPKVLRQLHSCQEPDL
jgi:FMN hydrolase / 5-amino-6-(5-phospho-D-ribitylamino)uracil phosphatase